MVKVECVIEGKPNEIYMDGGLYKQLITNVIPSVQKKDWDWFVVVDGQEGSGKSVFAFQLAKVLDPNFNLNKIVFNANQFIEAVLKSTPHSCIVFDEAFTGLSSRSSLSEINNLLVSLMMEMRQKNLFIILVMPSFFMLDKYAVFHRSKGLFHIEMRNKQRGYWGFYNKLRMKKLFEKGKKFFEYHHEKPIMFGRFMNKYTVDEEKYREIKTTSLSRKKRKTRAENYKAQRDITIFTMYKLLGENTLKTFRTLRSNGLDLNQAVFYDIINSCKKDLLKTED